MIVAILFCGLGGRVRRAGKDGAAEYEARQHDDGDSDQLLFAYAEFVGVDFHIHFLFAVGMALVA